VHANAAVPGHHAARPGIVDAPVSAGAVSCWTRRAFQSPAFVMRYIDWMALHKLNVLGWH